MNVGGPIRVDYSADTGYLYFDINGRLIGIPVTSPNPAPESAREGLARIVAALTGETDPAAR